MKNNNNTLTFDEYLQIRQEARLATLLFVSYTIIFFIACFFLVSQGARARVFVSVGMAAYLIIGMRLFIPPFHRRAYLELGQPELKGYSAKGVPVSLLFIKKQAIAYGIGLLLLLFLGLQALSTVPKKTESIDLPTISSTTEDIQPIPDLGNKEEQ